MTNNNYHMETLAIHAGQEPDPTTGAISMPIYQTSNFVQLEVGRDKNKGYIYSRVGNPTSVALEANMAALEEGNFALAMASGMAAVDAVMRLLHPGDQVIASADVYGGTYRLLDTFLRAAGVEVTFADLTNPEALRQAIGPRTKLVWLESPTNPGLKLVDIAALAEIAHAQGSLVGIDNTFATPYLQKPLTLGVDVVVHSATKYLGGHSDVIGGVIIVKDEALYEQLKTIRLTTGGVLGPQDSWLLLRGIKTLPLRMERHCQNAQALAEWLVTQPAVEQVIYPGLPEHPQHELARRQMRDFGGMVSVVLRGGVPAAAEMAKKTGVFALAVSLGGVESLLEVPSVMTHTSMAESELAVDPALIRLSVGIEHSEELKADLDLALAGL